MNQIQVTRNPARQMTSRGMAYFTTSAIFTEPTPEMIRKSVEVPLIRLMEFLSMYLMDPVRFKINWVTKPKSSAIQKAGISAGINVFKYWQRK